MEIKDFGLKDYKEILEWQVNLFNDLVATKKNKVDKKSEYILIGEHYPVITLGRRAKESNLLFPELYLNEKGIYVYHIGRGGDVTYHCPGQLISYPIIDLESHNLGVKDYVNLLEESVIKLLSEYGINGERVEGATGVWLGKGSSLERKICAIGIKCSHFCTMHGLALNVNADLSGFSLINPCGFIDKGVTSIEKELGHKVDMGVLKEKYLHILLSLILAL